MVSLLEDSIQFGSIKSNPELEKHRGELYKLRNLAQSLQYESDKSDKKGDNNNGNLNDKLNWTKKKASLEAAYIDRIEMEQQLQASKFKNETERVDLQNKIAARKRNIERMEDALGVPKQKKE